MAGVAPSNKNAFQDRRGYQRLCSLAKCFMIRLKVGLRGWSAGSELDELATRPNILEEVQATHAADARPVEPPDEPERPAPVLGKLPVRH
jgi:hypothetical protein